MGGPEVHMAGELARGWLSLRGTRRALIPLWLPGKTVQGFRRGYNTCPQQAVGKSPGLSGFGRNIVASECELFRLFDHNNEELEHLRICRNLLDKTQRKLLL